ncbi:hypothetical protein BD779DRAFT_1679434 [Infundibulicybe gibba]|nr:hypothetical protein BD779DRAFT_1679434 [Infundibulicybe gibba]
MILALGSWVSLRRHDMAYDRRQRSAFGYQLSELPITSRRRHVHQADTEQVPPAITANPHPSEFKEASPARRFGPVCKIQAKRGASSTAAFDTVLQGKFKKPTLLKRISVFGATKRSPQPTAAEQLIQHSIRKHATAFLDARDDLETKIGHLSRRLNFLMTESDLCAEANQLWVKINKEQKETKRLPGLNCMSFLLEIFIIVLELKNTEMMHRDAISELEKMEPERAEMVAEVEAQIERALASMAVDIDNSDYGSSRPPLLRLWINPLS